MEIQHVPAFFRNMVFGNFCESFGVEISACSGKTREHAEIHSFDVGKDAICVYIKLAQLGDSKSTVLIIIKRGI